MTGDTVAHRWAILMARRWADTLDAIAADLVPDEGAVAPEADDLRRSIGRFLAQYLHPRPEGR